MKILFIVPYPAGEAPSQRFRFEQYLGILAQHGHTVTLKSFLTLSDWYSVYEPGHTMAKMVKFFIAYLRRLSLLFSANAYDFIFIHREAAPAGPPLIEWFIAKVLRKKIIYDFDDAIWLTDKAHESGIEKFIRWRSKVKLISQWSYRMSCGNEYLCAYARQFNSHVVYNPTTLDTEQLHNPDLTDIRKTQSVVIGWTGSHSTLKYLKSIEPVLQAIEEKYPQVEILIIANQKPDLKLRSLKFLLWRKETEAKDLAQFDIGIMPMPDDEWTKGKCGFKALQYMAMKIPAVVSPVGVNATIVDHGMNGFHASTPQEWHQHLEDLINHESLRRQMGESGRKKVIAQYSVSSNTSTFLSLFS